jgi:hypothetical protein
LLKTQEFSITDKPLWTGTRRKACPNAPVSYFVGWTIRAPDIALTPRDVYYALDGQQRSTVQSVPFSLAFAVEVDNLSTTSKLNTLTSKFMATYFPARVRLLRMAHWSDQRINTFIREFDDGVVQCRPHQ